MNKNKIRTILNLFRNYQVWINKDYFFYIDNVNVNLAEVEFEPNNEVVYLFWEGSDGEEYRIKFDESGLSNARVKDGNLIIEDTEGDEIEIEGKVTSSKLKSAFMKMNKKKQVSRVLVSKFIQGIAT